MYHKSPMEKFNKNNPYIIIAKKVYDSIIDNVHIFGKMSIMSSIINSIIGIIISSIIIAITVITKEYFINILKLSIIIIINISFYFSLKDRLKYFISSSPSIQEFSRISELEVNDIIALNNEDVLKCIHGLYELRGELTSTLKFYNYNFIIIMCIQFIVLLLGII